MLNLLLLYIDRKHRSSGLTEDIQCQVYPFMEVTENVGLSSQHISACVFSHLLLVFLPEPIQTKTKNLYDHMENKS